MKKRNIVLLVFMIVSLAVLLGGVAYAWFESNFDPVVYSNEMKISATDGLVVQLTDNENATVINVRDVIRDFETQFGLAQVSTVDNETFYKRIQSNTGYEYVLAEANKDYIQVSFMISAETTIYGTETPAPTRKIYIKSLDMDVIGKDSDGKDIVISDTNFAGDALRTCLTFVYTDSETGIEYPHQYVLAKNDYETGIAKRLDSFIDKETGEVYDNTVLKSMRNETDGFVGYRNYMAIANVGIESASSYGTQDVYFLDNFVYNSLNTTFIPMEEIPVGKGSKVTIQIWLEGSDPRCSLDISGTKVRYNLVFGSYYYHVIFNSDGGTECKTKIFNALNKSVGELPTPTKAGYTFKGWYVDTNDESTKWSSSTVVSDSVTLTAKWE